MGSTPTPYHGGEQSPTQRANPNTAIPQPGNPEPEDDGLTPEQREKRMRDRIADSGGLDTGGGMPVEEPAP